MIRQLAIAAKKYNRLLEISKKYKEFLCKLALEEFGYINELDKWSGKYCDVIGYMINTTGDLQDKKKLLHKIKKQNSVPKKVIAFIEKNVNIQLGKGNGIEDKTLLDKYLVELDKAKTIEQEDELLRKIENIIKSESIKNGTRKGSTKPMNKKGSEKGMYIPRKTDIPISMSKMEASGIYTTKYETEISNYSFKEILERITKKGSDAKKLEFEDVRLFGDKILRNKVTLFAKADYKPKTLDELYIFKDNMIEVHKVFQDGTVYGKIIDTDNIDNQDYINRFGEFPITVFIKPKKEKNDEVKYMIEYIRSS
jgi:hypothetical protein